MKEQTGPQCLRKSSNEEIRAGPVCLEGYDNGQGTDTIFYVLHRKTGALHSEEDTDVRQTKQTAVHPWRQLGGPLNL